nr:hypothetical protein [uncultured Holophaga sp.]
MSPLRTLSVLPALVLLLGAAPSAVSLLAQGPPAFLKTEKSLDAVEHQCYEVQEGGKLTITGVLFGNIAIRKGGKVVIRGVVHGDVVNYGGGLEVVGHVTGTVLKKGGSTVVDAKSTVDGGVRF